MSLDPSERDQLRRKMATRMGSFCEKTNLVSCVSGHYYEDPHACELCQGVHANEILVIKNRAGKKMHVAADCLREMVRFQVADVEDLPRWLGKLNELEKEFHRRKLEAQQLRDEERKRLEKKVIVRKRSPVPENA